MQEQATVPNERDNTPQTENRSSDNLALAFGGRFIALMPSGVPWSGCSLLLRAAGLLLLPLEALRGVGSGNDGGGR